MFGLLRCERETNTEQPKRKDERTPRHGRIQNQIAANASKYFAQAPVIG